MCGRYVIALRAGELADVLEADLGDGVELQRSWNIAPTSTVPILVERPVPEETLTRREIHAARWGLLPRWAESASFSSKTFNARSETVLTKPSFRSAVRRRRCAVPGQGYYEWEARTEPSTGKVRRRPHYVSTADGAPILFAGLYEWWQDPERVAAGQQAAWVLSTTILTAPSPQTGEHSGEGAEVLERLGSLHDRVPLPMSQQMTEEWIVPGEMEEDRLAVMLDRLRQESTDLARGWRVHEVDPAVGNVGNNGPELVEPIAGLF